MTEPVKCVCKTCPHYSRMIKAAMNDLGRMIEENEVDASTRMVEIGQCWGDITVGDEKLLYQYAPLVEGMAYVSIRCEARMCPMIREHKREELKAQIKWLNELSEQYAKQKEQ